ncbi:MAG: DNA cytosine methyltransferase [Gallionellaceae bacterium]
MKTMHLFAGAGGGLLADLILGHEPIIAIEWDTYACQVLRERAAEGWFPGLQVWGGDVRLFNPSEYAGKVDILAGGFPCQDISVAGNQAGVGEGTRSGLYREVLRIADEVRPGYLFLENVAAITSNGLDTVLADLAERGYNAVWKCLSAAEIGANHKRDRWWLLAYPDSAQCEGRRLSGRAHQEHTDTSGGGWWKTESDVGRVANGVAHRVDRLKAIGNGQVPLQAATAFSILWEMMLTTSPPLHNPRDSIEP